MLVSLYACLQMMKRWTAGQRAAAAAIETAPAAFYRVKCWMFDSGVLSYLVPSTPVKSSIWGGMRHKAKTQQNVMV
jgi:hypothetical protein